MDVLLFPDPTFIDCMRAKLSAGAGPSRPTRPLKRVYDETFRRCQHAHLVRPRQRSRREPDIKAYEKERMEEQLDDIADWLDTCNAPPLIKRVTGTKRIRIALMQSEGYSIRHQGCTDEQISRKRYQTTFRPWQRMLSRFKRRTERT